MPSLMEFNRLVGTLGVNLLQPPPSAGDCFDGHGPRISPLPPPVPPGDSALARGATAAGQRYVGALNTVWATDEVVNATVARVIAVGRQGRERAERVLANYRARAAVLSSTNTPEGVRMLASLGRQSAQEMRAVISDTKTAYAALASEIDGHTAQYRAVAPRPPGAPAPVMPADDTIVDDPKPRGGGIETVDNQTFKQGPELSDERRRNQIDAFRQMFGRVPTSAADWATAAALDPHTYDPKYQGTNSEVRVVRIRPEPGQGVVRVSQWIEQRDVRDVPPHWDFGNNRGPDPDFDPENTKVTTYIDYENGIVVMRQNPSVEVTADGSPGRVKVGVPQGSVTQTADGAVRIKYDAGNPFAPGVATSPAGPFVGSPRALTVCRSAVHARITRRWRSIRICRAVRRGLCLSIQQNRGGHGGLSLTFRSTTTLG